MSFILFIKFFVQKDYSSQFFIKQPRDIPKFKKIIIQLSFANDHFKIPQSLGLFLILLEFLSQQKPTFSFSKKDVALWRLRKRDLVSVFVTLRGKRLLSLLERILITYFCRVRIVEINNIIFKDNVLFIKISDVIVFSEIEKELGNLQQQSSIKGCIITCIVVFNKTTIRQVEKKLLLAHLQII